MSTERWQDEPWLKIPHMFRSIHYAIIMEQTIVSSGRIATFAASFPEFGI
jgi:hypothetical protein